MALLTACAVLLSAGAYSASALDENVTDGDYVYKLVEDGAEVVQYNGSKEELVIPDTFGGKPVVSIGKKAFRSADVVKVTVPKTVKRFCDHAFSDCRELKQINLPEGLEVIESFALHRTKITKLNFPDSLKEIGGGAFEESFKIKSVKFGKGLKRIPKGAFDLTAIKSVTIPDNIEHIGTGAFSECKSLTTVKIGKGVSSIGYEVFSWNKKLSKLTVDKRNKYFVSEGNVLYNKKKTRLIYYSLNRKNKSFTAPKSLKKLDGGVFRGNQYIEKVTLTDKIKKIPYDAFYGAAKLKKINLPKSLEVIEGSAFRDCRINSVKIPKNVKKIGYCAFSYSKIKKLEFEKGARPEIDEEAFSGNDFTEVTYLPFDCGNYRFTECRKLRKVNFTSDVTYIYNDFINSGLKEITIPDTVKVITDHALGFEEHFGLDGGYTKIKDFVIKGSKGSVAETYANEYGIKFVDVNK